ncbi:hypothetical protein MBLNU459_g7167t1 [Dothideomycetes sp. NU459]
MGDRMTYKFQRPQVSRDQGLNRLNCWALTFGQHKAGVTTSDSITYLNEQFLDVLRGHIAAKDAPKVQHDLSPYDSASALLRTHFRLATLLIHEFAHAFRLATFAKNPDTRTYMQGLWGRDIQECEPFHRDDRLAELGLALEQTVFGGRAEALGPQPPAPHAAVPYGFGAATFPGIMAAAGSAQARAAPAWSTTTTTTMPASDELRGVLMRDVHKFFTRRFWERDAVRLGLGAFRHDRGHAIRVVRRRGEKVFWPDKTGSYASVG